MATPAAVFTPVHTEAEFKRLTKWDRLANFPPTHAKRLRKVEQAFLTWQDTGDDRPMVTALSKYVKACAWRLHNGKLYAVEREELEQILWEAAARCIVNHSVTNNWFLLEKVRRKIKSAAQDELRRINAAKRKPDYFAATFPMHNVKGPARCESPESAYLRKEFVQEVYSALSPKQQQAVALWSAGYTFEDIGQHLNISGQSAHRLVERAMPHLQRVAREYADVFSQADGVPT